MHPFDELIRHCAEFNLQALDATETKIVAALQSSAATRLVKGLQMTLLARAVAVVGMFSMFDAALQDALRCDDGFREATALLSKAGDRALAQRFSDMQMAINVLKHGKGRSYEALIARVGELPFRIRLPGEDSFFEGNVSEISTLIEVDNDFVMSGVAIISDVTAAVRRAMPDTYL